MKDYLIAHAALMGIEMLPEQAEKFEKYHEMLEAANREMNLTRISPEVSESCDRNYLDSLTLLEYIGDAKTLIDVGSGAGFPGIPLAIMRPDVKIVLMDTLQKRVAFLSSVIKELGLNAEAVHSRCEDAAKKPEYRDSFDIATARAVAEMNILSEWLLPFVKPGGKMAVLKGMNAESEVEAAGAALTALNAELRGVYPADIPGRDWQHCLIVADKTGETPARFPRKAGIAEKRPIK